MDKNIYTEYFYIDPGIEDFMDLNEDSNFFSRFPKRTEGSGLMKISLLS